MSERVIVFDMDGVLVDPTESFRRAALEVVERLAGRPGSSERIIEIKNEGGYNDDADVALRMIRELGGAATRDDVERLGWEIFWGQGGEGLIQRERWLVEGDLLERLAVRARLAVFTGRGRRTAGHTLGRFAPEIVFDPIVTSSELENLKPAPDGLLRVREAHPEAEIVFVGDNIDDARAARAADVPFIGVAESDLHQRDEIVDLFARENAAVVIESVNQIEQAVDAAFATARA